MLVPFMRTSGAVRHRIQRAGTVALGLFLIKGLVWLAVATAVVLR
jgi:hypothetical protein